MDTKTQPRNNSLDWLRVLGILLVFIYHTTRFYNVEDWVVKNAIWYPSVQIWNMFFTSWMMPLMFVLSGAALFYALGKGGIGRFLKDKVIRLLVPLLVGDLTARTPRLDQAYEAVLPFYILHQTVLLTVGYIVLRWGLPDILEGTTIAVISVAIILAIYEYLVRRWNVMRFLFGMKLLSTRSREKSSKDHLALPVLDR